MRQIFINLPVKDLKASMTFFGSLGFDFNAEFTDDNAACMIISEEAFIMLIESEYFKTFIEGGIADLARGREVIITISAGSREEVNEILRLALESGGKEGKKGEEQDWMYGRSFRDLDDHLWEILYMDVSRIRNA
ncbi:MAG: VOC family protein [Bacillota bacterium]